MSASPVESTPIPDEWRRRYVGGKGLGVHYLYDELSADVDLPGEEDVMLFVLDPLSGYLPGESRYAATTKSPLTGYFLDSYAGGELPDSLADALGSHMGLLVMGVAFKPVRLVVEDGDATIEPVKTWGAGTADTAQTFPNAAVACISPVGERQVAYATIASDAGDHHAGRGEAGAVMGPERPKAVVARGAPPDADGLNDLRDVYATKYREIDTRRWLRASETVETIDPANEIGVLLTQGWSDGQFEAVEELGITTVRDRAVGRERTDTEIPDGYRVAMEGSDYVPCDAIVMTLGVGLDINDFDVITVLGRICDRLGVDLVNVGSAVAWTVRASATGALDRLLSFGEPGGARALSQGVVEHKPELDDTFADGIEAVAMQFDGRDLVPTMKPMELPAYDPRGAQSMAPAYATSGRGTYHRRARPIERKTFDDDQGVDRAAAEVTREQNRQSTLWSLIADDFSGDAFDDLDRRWLESVDFDPVGGLAIVSKRIQNVTWLSSVCKGISYEDDSLPATLREPLESGLRVGTTIDRDGLDSMFDTYYRRRGWTVDDVPTVQTIDRLKLTVFANGFDTLDD